MLHFLKTRLATFRDETGGTVSVEFIIMAPLIFWAYASMYSWFDAYRQVNIHEKAAFTIADMLSRETDPINGKYIDASRNLLQFLTRSETVPDMRISIIRYVDDDDAYHLDWSHTRGTSFPVLSDNDIASWHDKLPVMVSGERIILVETQMNYTPPFLYGLMKENTLQTFVFARPRFAPKLCWDTCA